MLVEDSRLGPGAEPSELAEVRSGVGPTRLVVAGGQAGGDLIVVEADGAAPAAGAARGDLSAMQRRDVGAELEEARRRAREAEHQLALRAAPNEAPVVSFIGLLPSGHADWLAKWALQEAAKILPLVARLLKAQADNAVLRERLEVRLTEGGGGMPVAPAVECAPLVPAVPDLLVLVNLFEHYLRLAGDRIVPSLTAARVEAGKIYGLLASVAATEAENRLLLEIEGRLAASLG